MTIDYACTLPVVGTARLVAAAVHADDRYGGKPYMWHLEQVVGLVIEHRADIGDWWPYAAAMGWLHDVIEDHPDRFHYMIGHVHPEIIAGVQALTRRKGQEPKAYYAGIWAAGSLAVSVKVCDRIANMRACLSPEMRSDKRLQKYVGERGAFDRMRAGTGMDGLWAALDVEMERASRPRAIGHEETHPGKDGGDGE